MIESHGSDWSEGEIDLVVADYFDMLRSELAGCPYSKSQHNEALQTLVARSRKAIEFKHCNITAVLERLGMRGIKGYRALHHIQNALIDGVERYLAAQGQPLFDLAERTELVAEPTSLWIGPPPVIASKEKETERLRQLIRRFDPAERDARNRKLGKQGEELVHRYECERLLAAGRRDLARKVEWTSEERGDGAGYDIRSFALDGSERLIEVKTTNGPARTPFFLSENERSIGEERWDVYSLLRLYNFTEKPCGFELKPPWSERLALHPQSYRAELV
jgi:hypothetical protein